MKNIQYISENAICCGCGACKAECLFGAIDMRRNPAGFLYAHVDEGKCVECKRCLKVCPSVSENQQLDRYSDTYEMTQGEFLGYATDKRIRRNSQSGGMVTGLLLYLRESGKIDGAITNMFVPDKRCNDAFFAVTKKDIINSKGSFYAQSSVIAKMNDYIQQKIAVVALGCQSEAINLREKAGQKRPDYVIGLVCGHQCSQQMVEDICEVAEIPQNEKLSSFLFRCSHPAYGGWPGDSLIITDKHRYIIDRNVRFAKVPLYQSFRCYLCCNHLNTYADIVCGDPWGIDGNLSEGFTVVVARSEKGKKLIEDAQNAGYVSTMRINKENAIKNNDRLLFEKSALTGYRLCKKNHWLYPYDIKDEYLDEMLNDNLNSVNKYLKDSISYSREYYLAENENKANAISERRWKEIQKESSKKKISQITMAMLKHFNL